MFIIILYLQYRRIKINMSKKIIIVGAGPGGLSAAMLLAKNGFDVEWVIYLIFLPSSYL